MLEYILRLIAELFFVFQAIKITMKKKKQKSACPGKSLSGFVASQLVQKQR